MRSEEGMLIDEFAEPAYLGYAIKTALDRAIPFVSDGMKPVHRRILYAMHQLKLLPQSAKPVKSARVVGDCFAAGMRVHAQFGFTPIEDMRVGDRVFRPDGSLANVVQIFRNPPSRLFDVRFANGFRVKSTPDQLFRAVRVSVDHPASDAAELLEWVRAVDLPGRFVQGSDPSGGLPGPLLAYRRDPSVPLPALVGALDGTDIRTVVEVVSVTEIEPEWTYDIQIDSDDHAFLLEGVVVHNCIGKYHPHGDSSVYDAMVAMAQPWELRYPLVHGEGNFGSRDGDGAAAMRYTEARLAPIAATLLDEIVWDTVDFRPNYDNTQTEPVTLPARLPFAMLNGMTGIAVGMGTTLLPHNLGEVVEAVKIILSSRKTPTVEQIMEVMPGPDFSTGAQIISTPEEIARAYRDGRGSIRLRSRYVVERYGKGNRDWRLVLTEIPHPTSVAKLIVAINALMNPKPKENGKKATLTPAKARLKKLFSDLIDEVRDGSDINSAVRLEIEPRSSSQDPEELFALLCAHTDVEMNVSPNFVCVDLDGRPHPAGMVEWLSQWCDYRIMTVRRRLTDEKARLDARLHILAGRLTVLDVINDVIRLIQESEDPKADLISRYGLSEIQADDVLDMRLRQLANLEKYKLLEEQKAKQAESDRLAKILASGSAIRRLIIKELDADAKAFGDPRRTLIEPASASVRATAVADLPSVSFAPEPVAIAVTDRAWISWKPVKSAEEAQSTDFKIKEGDRIRQIYFGDRNADQLLLMDRSGRAYALRLQDLPSKSDTLPLAQFFAAKDPLVQAVLGGPESRWLVSGSGGYGFVVSGSDWINRMSAGKAFLSLRPGEEPLSPVPLDLAEGAQVVAMSSDGRAIAYPLEEVKQLPKGRGVALIGLAKGERLADVTVVPAELQSLEIHTAKGPVKIPRKAWEAVLGDRSASRKGRALHAKSRGAVFAVSPVVQQSRPVAEKA